jgi:heme oxygenase
MTIRYDFRNQPTIPMAIDSNPPLLDTSADSRITVRQQLRLATHAAHVRLNHHPMLAGLTRPGFSLAQYRRILAAYYPFYAVMEPAILSLTIQTNGFSYAQRRKLPWLIEDLRALGDTPANLKCKRVFAIPADAAELIGTLYAIEGSTLGGQVISRHLAANLGLTPERGARFFSGYGADTESRWAAFCGYAETLVDDPMQRERAGIAALQVFNALEGQLDDSQNP